MSVHRTAFGGTEQADILCSAGAEHMFASSRTYVCLEPNIRKQAPLYRQSRYFVPVFMVFCTCIYDRVYLKGTGKCLLLVLFVDEDPPYKTPFQLWMLTDA